MCNIYTHFNETHGSTSRLDHIITTSAKEYIDNIKVHYDYATSDHLPLSAIMYLSHVLNTDLADNRCSKSQPHRVVKWDRLSVDDLHRYQIATEELADDINLNLNVITCNNSSCDIQAHLQYTDALYAKITSCMLNASDKHISVRKMKVRPTRFQVWTKFAPTYTVMLGAVP